MKRKTAFTQTRIVLEDAGLKLLAIVDKLPDGSDERTIIEHQARYLFAQARQMDRLRQWPKEKEEK